MDLRRIIKATKASVKTGEWKHGEIPRSQWPSRRAKAKAYKFGPRYQWRIISFLSAEHECRVRIIFNESKQICRATLGVTLNGETVTICDYEYHASEPGWHCHARCDELASVDATTNRFGAQRIPGAREYHRRSEFKFRQSDLTAVGAFNCTVSFFKIDRGEGTL